MSNFINVGIVCEGLTEMKLVAVLNKQYFNKRQISLKAIGMLKGNVSISRVANAIRNLSKRKGISFVTTFVDYYGFKGDRGKNVEALEEMLKQESKIESMIPYIQKYETEALLFSNVDVVARVMKAGDKERVALEAVISKYNSPEDINNSPETAPSKRLMAIFPGYKKTIDGIEIASQTGVEALKSKCLRFNQWLDAVEAKANEHRDHKADCK